MGIGNLFISKNYYTCGSLIRINLRPATHETDTYTLGCGCTHKTGITVNEKYVESIIK